MFYFTRPVEIAALLNRLVQFSFRQHDVDGDLIAHVACWLRIIPRAARLIMPYKAISDLPDSVREHVPKHAQEIYKESFNSAWTEYADKGGRQGDESREEVAHKVAWSAVKKKYSKGADGDWHAR